MCVERISLSLSRWFSSASAWSRTEECVGLACFSLCLPLSLSSSLSLCSVLVTNGILALCMSVKPTRDRQIWRTAQWWDVWRRWGLKQPADEDRIVSPPYRISYFEATLNTTALSHKILLKLISILAANHKTNLQKLSTAPPVPLLPPVMFELHYRWMMNEQNLTLIWPSWMKFVWCHLMRWRLSDFCSHR